MNKKIVILCIAKNSADTAEVLKFSLEELGFKNISIVKKLNEMKCDYLFTIKAWNPGSPSKDLCKYSILVQREQILDQRKNGVYSVGDGFDFSLESYEENLNLKFSGKKILYCPSGYSPLFDYKNNSIKESIDVFHFGSFPERRKTMYNFLKDNNIDILHERHIWGEERDKAILRAKINIGIKAKNIYYFPTLRFLLVASKGKFYLSEKSDGGYGPYVPGKHFIEFEGKSDMLDKIKYYLKHENERNEFASFAYNDIKNNLNYTKFLNECLKYIESNY
ncbi:MAG: glycosyltransferase family protein [Atribacterota bacterium]